ncbi:MAG TPA: FAD-dependent oxidoreductase, partial [Alphaproteobacteria bacterium]|nr:FAD-dependent oxidoreductase [Alphaproteobacteria bacterium]
FEDSPVQAIDRTGTGQGLKQLKIAGGRAVNARIIMLCGNAYLADVGLPQMTRRLAEVVSSVLATKPLSENMVRQILPTGAAVADCNTALNYYRIDARRRMIFGGRSSYSKLNFRNITPDLRRRMTDVFPILQDAGIEQVWSGKIGITMNRIPHFGRTDDDIYFVQGFSGHGVALTGQAGRMLAEAVIGDATQFDVMSSLTHRIFPGGPLRTPALALGMAWFKMRDRLRL